MSGLREKQQIKWFLTLHIIQCIKTFIRMSGFEYFTQYYMNAVRHLNALDVNLYIYQMVFRNRGYVTHITP